MSLDYQWIVLRYHIKYGHRISSVSGWHLLSQSFPPNYFFSLFPMMLAKYHGRKDFFIAHALCRITPLELRGASTSWTPCFKGVYGSHKGVPSYLSHKIWREVTKVSDGPCTWRGQTKPLSLGGTKIIKRKMAKFWPLNFQGVEKLDPGFLLTCEGWTPPLDHSEDMGIFWSLKFFWVILTVYPVIP